MLKRKLTALALSFAMLASFPSAVAADEPSAQPTVEEILSEYHAKAFAAQQQGEVAPASSRSRQSNTKTLEQETVDALNAAGYTAYNVTAESYEALEKELKTDFGAMGMQENGSYIVVIEGTESDATPDDGVQPASTISPEIELGQPDDTGAYPATYTYNGVTYDVRFITVTSAEGGWSDRTESTLGEMGLAHKTWKELAEFCLLTVLDNLAQGPYASIASLLAKLVTDDGVIHLSPGAMNVFAYTTWNRQFIQVYWRDKGYWCGAQCSEYANITAYTSGAVLNESTNFFDIVQGDTIKNTIYSADYFDINKRLYDAVSAMVHGANIPHDRVDVKFYLGQDDLTLQPGSEYLFTHYSPPISKVQIDS